LPVASGLAPHRTLLFASSLLSLRAEGVRSLGALGDPLLDEDVEMIGEGGAETWFRSSLGHADLFVRLCDVDPSGPGPPRRHRIRRPPGLTW
jgi:hypothetical protein